MREDILENHVYAEWSIVCTVCDAEDETGGETDAEAAMHFKKNGWTVGEHNGERAVFCEDCAPCS